MESHLTAKFRALFKQLLQEVRCDAEKSYLLWKSDHFHSSLHFKRISEKKNLWSVRASLGWRALGIWEEPDVIVWVWVGPHAGYDEAIKPKNVKKCRCRDCPPQFSSEKHERAMKPDRDLALDDDAETFSCSVIQLAPTLPFQISFQVPFSRNRVNIGIESFERLRKRTLLKPDDVDAHITLAAHLLSPHPFSPSPVSLPHAAEAAKHLVTALSMMPSDEEVGDKAQWKAMAHDFLGDALIILGQRSEARGHWERAIVLDPVAPPDGISGRALDMLNKYPQL